MINFDWKANNFVGKLEQRVVRNLKNVAKKVEGDLKAVVGQAHSPPPSKPGEPPHMDSEWLRDSIEVKADKNGLHIQFAEHGLHLEYGTSQMAPRPWLRPTLASHAEKVLKILGQ